MEIDKETDEDNGVVYLDENGEEIDKRTLMMMMKNNKIVQGEDGAYYQVCDDDELEERNELRGIRTADDYINDEEEEKAKSVKGKYVKDRIIHQPSTS